MNDHDSQTVNWAHAQVCSLEKLRAYAAKKASDDSRNHPNERVNMLDPFS
jgi:hypothetical protein